MTNIIIIIIIIKTVIMTIIIIIIVFIVLQCDGGALMQTAWANTIKVFHFTV